MFRIVFLKNAAIRHPKENAFIDKIEQQIIRSTFSQFDELQVGVYSALVNYMRLNGMLTHEAFDGALHPTATLSDLDPDRIRVFVGLARERRQFPIPFSEANISRILTSLHLLTDDGRICNAALLLFAKDTQRWFPSATIKCAQFYGTHVQKPLITYQIFNGSVFDLVDKAAAFVAAHIDTHIGERTDGPVAALSHELPMQAVTEAIVNAVVHRDYNSIASVQVMLFKDRLEIWNPGRLPQGMTVERLHVEHPSVPFNPLLAQPVYLAGYIEQLGTGTIDILERCAEMQLPEPSFVLDEGFRTVIPKTQVGLVKDETHSTQAFAQVSTQVLTQVPAQVKELVLTIKDGNLAKGEILQLHNFVHKSNKTLLNKYFGPAIAAGYVEMQYPDRPNHPQQRYHLTSKGMDLLHTLTVAATDENAKR